MQEITVVRGQLPRASRTVHALVTHAVTLLRKASLVQVQVWFLGAQKPPVRAMPTHATWQTCSQIFQPCPRHGYYGWVNVPRIVEGPFDA
jgi:hypothetical protein